MKRIPTFSRYKYVIVFRVKKKHFVHFLDNYKLIKKPVPAPVKKETPPAVMAQVKRDTVIAPVNTPTQTIVSNTFVVNNTPSNISQQVVRNNVSVKTDTAKTTSVQTPTPTVNQYPYVRKRRKRVTAEQLEALKTPLMLNQNSSIGDAEPELKIKTKDSPPD